LGITRLEKEDGHFAPLYYSIALSFMSIGRTVVALIRYEGYIDATYSSIFLLTAFFWFFIIAFATPSFECRNSAVNYNWFVPIFSFCSGIGSSGTVYYLKDIYDHEIQLRAQEVNPSLDFVIYRLALFIGNLLGSWVAAESYRLTGNLYMSIVAPFVALLPVLLYSIQLICRRETNYLLGLVKNKGSLNPQGLNFESIGDIVYWTGRDGEQASPTETKTTTNKQDEAKVDTDLDSEKTAIHINQN